MTERDELTAYIMDLAKLTAGVPVYHAPATSAGEKIIYRCSPGSYDGEWESYTITMRFISASSADAQYRAREVSRYLCAPGDSSRWKKDGCQAFVVRAAGGGSGYIGRTGHFFVLTKFEIRRRLPTTFKTAVVSLP